LSGITNLSKGTYAKLIINYMNTTDVEIFDFSIEFDAHEGFS